MKAYNKISLIVLPLIILALFIFAPLTKGFAATSPTLGTDLSSFSVLGGQAVTNTNSTTTTGGVGVSPLTSITGFPPGIAGGDNSVNLHSNDANAIAAQADNLTAFGTLDQTCDIPAYQFGSGVVDLVGANLVPGVYCADAFTLSGTLTLNGVAGDVWIFKSASTLITSGTANVVGGDPCNVWWRVGSSATLSTNTSLIGNVLALNGVNAMNTGATLNGRLLVQAAGTVTLDGNTINGPTCASTQETTPTPTPTQTPVGGPGDGLSDGRSSTPNNTSTGGQVLGSSTTTLAATGSNDQFIRIFVSATVALLVFLLGKARLRKNEAS